MQILLVPLSDPGNICLNHLVMGIANFAPNDVILSFPWQGASIHFVPV
jgi:hypothetical protein